MILIIIFFPIAYDVDISMESQFLDIINIYGTPILPKKGLSTAQWTPKTHKFYPNLFKEIAFVLVLCVWKKKLPRLATNILSSIFNFLSPLTIPIVDVNTCFPGQVRKNDGNIKGGLILVKMKEKIKHQRTEMDSKTIYNVIIRTTYRDLDGKKQVVATKCSLHQNNLHNDDYFTDMNIRKGIILTRYVEETKRILTDAQQHSINNKLKEEDNKNKLEILEKREIIFAKWLRRVCEKDAELDTFPEQFDVLVNKYHQLDK